MLLPAILATALSGPVDQSIEARPAYAETGQQVEIVVDGAAAAGFAIEVRWPDGRVEAVGPTDAQGRARFTPAAPGDYRLSARRGELLLITPLRVVAAPNRLLYGLLLVPVGAALLWWNLRTRSSRSPCRPAP